MEKSFIRLQEKIELIRTYLCAIDDSLKYKNNVGRAAAERYFDLAFQGFEDIFRISENLYSALEQKDRFNYSRARQIRNKLIHRYSNFVEAEMFEQLLKSKEELMVLLTKLKW